MDAAFATALVSWLTWCLFQISHRAPWGLWTSQQRTWYEVTKSALHNTGLAPSTYGTKDLIFLPTLGVFIALFQQGVETNTGVFTATIVLLLLTLAMDKISFRTLFWDYHDAWASFWTLLCVQTPLWVASATLVLCNGLGWRQWLLFAALVFGALDAAYHVYMMWVWRGIRKRPNRMTGI